MILLPLEALVYLQKYCLPLQKILALVFLFFPNLRSERLPDAESDTILLIKEDGLQLKIKPHMLELLCFFQCAAMGTTQECQHIHLVSEMQGHKGPLRSKNPDQLVAQRLNLRSKF